MAGVARAEVLVQLPVVVFALELDPQRAQAPGPDLEQGWRPRRSKHWCRTGPMRAVDSRKATVCFSCKPQGGWFRLEKQGE